MVYAVLVKNVEFDYGTFSLRDVSMALREGEQKALLGPNGSGKTTLLRLILGLLRPSSGEISVLGIPVIPENFWQVRQRVGYLFQNPQDQLFAPTVWEDVAFGPRNLGLCDDEVEQRVQWALDIVEMSDLAYRPVNKLSHGQAKRAALAGVIAMRPQILFLDEPFTGLDFRMVRNMVDIVDRLRSDGGVSVLFTTHNRFFVENWAESVVVMDAGRVVFDGPVEDALADERVRSVIGDWESLRREMRSPDCVAERRRYG